LRALAAILSFPLTVYRDHFREHRYGLSNLTFKYRKLDPGPFEGIVFYDHPSGRTRILTAMRWKAEHPETWTASGATR